MAAKKKTSTSHVLLTGFPGFIGKRLLARLAERHPEERYHLLVEQRMLSKAKDTLAHMDPSLDLRERCELVVGDITKGRLGMDPDTHDQLRKSVTRVWHLAAIYDLAVGPVVAHQVNVRGTVNVLDFCESCSKLDALCHVSTCYVSGRRTGLILESELDKGQTFKNHYESTKFWAEMEVQERSQRVPWVIFRPAIVVGDSKTGETDKYDGPYFVMKLLSRLPRWLPMVHIGPGNAVVNITPVDFTVDAMAEIADNPEAKGLVFQLSDPHALTSRELMELMLERMGRPKPRGSLPPKILEAALSVERIVELTGIPKQTIEYFNHPAVYDSANTQRLLEGTGITCPRFPDYFDVIYRYMLEHPQPR